MSEIKRKTEENIEDVKRISNIINRRIKKSFRKLGPPGKDKKNKNPFLRSDGGFSLVEIFPSYKDKRKRKAKR
jgi:hypothetical protein